MKPKTLILMGLAVTCGLGASYMTSQLLAERGPAEENKVAVLVTKRNISIGEPIRKPEEMFEKKEFTAGQEPKDALPAGEKELEALKGKLMKVSLRKGDHVTPNDVSGEGGLQIPEGHLAMGFPVTNVSAASGFASLPLSRVDVILTIKRSDDKTSRSKFLLRNVLVLAADTQVDRQTGLAAPASVVTFALKPSEVLTMQMAQQLGPLTLALRKPNDKKNDQDADDVTAESILAEVKKDQPTTAVAQLPLPAKQVEKTAPTVLPQTAAKPEAVKPVTPAPPVVAQATEQPKVVAPERPNHRLLNQLFQNGKHVQVHQQRLFQDGTPILDHDNQASGVAPPRKNAPKNQDDF